MVNETKETITKRSPRKRKPIRPQIEKLYNSFQTQKKLKLPKNTENSRKRLVKKTKGVQPLTYFSRTSCLKENKPNTILNYHTLIEMSLSRKDMKWTHTDRSITLFQAKWNVTCLCFHNEKKQDLYHVQVGFKNSSFQDLAGREESGLKCCVSNNNYKSPAEDLSLSSSVKIGKARL